MNNKSSELNEKEYRVVISGLDLPDEESKRIEEEIRKSVLKVVATMDLKGKPVFKDLPEQFAAAAGGPIIMGGFLTLQ